MKFKRILLKLSGEAPHGEQKGGIDPAVVSMIADQVKTIREMGVEVAWSSAAATSSAAWQAPPRAWTAPPPTTWACWPP